jgi:hypothetical protein
MRDWREYCSRVMLRSSRRRSFHHTGAILAVASVAVLAAACGGAERSGVAVDAPTGNQLLGRAVTALAASPPSHLHLDADAGWQDSGAERSVGVSADLHAGADRSGGKAASLDLALRGALGPLAIDTADHLVASRPAGSSGDRTAVALRIGDTWYGESIAAGVIDPDHPPLPADTADALVKLPGQLGSLLTGPVEAGDRIDGADTWVMHGSLSTDGVIALLDALLTTSGATSDATRAHVDELARGVHADLTVGRADGEPRRLVVHLSADTKAIAAFFAPSSTERSDTTVTATLTLTMEGFGQPSTIDVPATVRPLAELDVTKLGPNSGSLLGLLATIGGDGGSRLGAALSRLGAGSDAGQVWPVIPVTTDPGPIATVTAPTASVPAP